MKRFPALLGAFTLAAVLVGCGGESHDALVNQTVNLMNESATVVGTIKDKVAEAVKNSKDDKSKFDLGEAVNATQQLKVTGSKLQGVKQRVEAARGSITDVERAENAEAARNKITAALKELVEKKDELQKALKEAEAVNKKKTEELKAKLREAEAPFEAIARQS